MTSRRPVDDVIHGDGLTVRAWRAGDRSSLVEILDVSRREFEDWLPGVIADLAELDEFLSEVAATFGGGEAWHYAIDVDGEAVGQVSLHAREAGEGEIGYWVRSDRTGAGIASRAVGTLAEAALAGPFAVLEIRCDAGNARSAGVAHRAGFAHMETIALDPTLTRTRAQTGREMRWERERPRHEGARLLDMVAARDTIVVRWLTAGDAGDLDAFDDLLHPDAVIHAPGNLSTTSAEEEKEVWRQALAAMPDLRHEVQEVVVDGDVEMARVVVTGTMKGGFGGIEGTGRSFRIDQAVITHLREGKVAEAWEIADIAGLREQVTGD